MQDPFLFGQAIGRVITAINDMIEAKDVPGFLSKPHPLLGDKSPLELIWEGGSDGEQRVINLMEAAGSGVFS